MQGPRMYNAPSSPYPSPMPVPSQQGWTLVELMIAVAVLAVLTAIAIPAYNGYISTSRTTECLNNLSSIKLAEEEYFLENQEYFYGASASVLENQSGNLWELAGDEPQCDYAVSGAGNTWSATASAKADSQLPTGWTKTLTND